MGFLKTPRLSQLTRLVIKYKVFFIRTVLIDNKSGGDYGTAKWMLKERVRYCILHNLREKMHTRMGIVYLLAQLVEQRPS